MATAPVYSPKKVERRLKDGIVHDTVEVPASRALPDVIIWGVYERQKLFMRTRHDEYREVSYWHALMPPLAGLSSRCF
jgi:hypothetical protein